MPTPAESVLSDVALAKICNNWGYPNAANFARAVESSIISAIRDEPITTERTARQRERTAYLQGQLDANAGAGDLRDTRYPLPVKRRLRSVILSNGSGFSAAEVTQADVDALQSLVKNPTEVLPDAP